MYRIGNANLFTETQGLFLSVYVDFTMAGEKQNMDVMWKKWMKGVDLDEPTSFSDQVNLGCTQRECEPNKNLVDKYRNISFSSWRMLISMNHHSFLIRCTWGALHVNVKQMKFFLSNTKKFLSHLFLLEQPKITRMWRTSRKNSSLVLRHGGRTPKNAWRDVSTWQTTRHNYTKLQVLAWMIITSWKRNLNQLEKYQKFARKLHQNACTWNELAGQTFNDQWTNLHGQSHNGHRLVAEEWQD